MRLDLRTLVAVGVMAALALLPLAALAMGEPYWLRFWSRVMILALAAVPPLFEDIKRDDPARNISVPQELLHGMEVQVAYNDRHIFFRFELPTDQPYFYHDYLIYQEDGSWQREGRSTAGPQRYGFYEDRISFLLDDGSVPEFARYGGFITVSGAEMRFFSNAAAEAVSEHPYFGQQRGRSDVRKFLPETRYDPADWRTVKPPEELRVLQEAGYFLDLWHWRSHRSQPAGWSDDEFVLDYRWSDEESHPAPFPPGSQLKTPDPGHHVELNVADLQLDAGYGDVRVPAWKR